MKAFWGWVCDFPLEALVMFLSVALAIFITVSSVIAAVRPAHASPQSVQVDSYVIWRERGGSTLTQIETKAAYCFVLLTPDRRVQAPYAWDGSVSCVSR